MEEQYFGYVMFGGIALFVIWLLILGKWFPGSGADQVDWRPSRSPEVEAELELDDVDQMIDAQNALRRRGGRSERSLEDVEDDIERTRAAHRAWLARQPGG
jgi:hypothetical protein